MEVRVWWTRVSTMTLYRRTTYCRRARITRQNFPELAVWALQVWKILKSLTSHPVLLQEESQEWFQTMGFQFCMSWGNPIKLSHCQPSPPASRFGSPTMPPIRRKWSASVPEGLHQCSKVRSQQVRGPCIIFFALQQTDEKFINGGFHLRAASFSC